MVLLAAYQALLARHTSQQDLVVGTPVAGRRDAQTERMIGFFVNMLALRTDLSGDPSFSELISRVRATTLAAYEHQDLPFDRLVEELRPERDLSRSPIFQTIFTLHNQPAPRTPLPGLTWTAEPGAVGVAKYDLSLVLTERDGGLAGALEYNTDLFDRATAERLADRFQRLLEAAVAEPDLAYTRLAITGPDEQAELDRWNDTAAAQPEPAADHRTLRSYGRRPARSRGADRRGRDADLRRAGPTGQPARPPVDRPRGRIRAARRPAGRPVGGDGGGSARHPQGRGRVRAARPGLPAGAAGLHARRRRRRRRWSPRRAWPAPPAFDGPIVRLDADGRCWPGTPRRRPRRPSTRISSRTCSTPPAPPADRRASRSPTGRWSTRCSARPAHPDRGRRGARGRIALLRRLRHRAAPPAGRGRPARGRAPRAVVTDGVRLVELVRTSGATAMMVPTPFGRILVEAGWPGDGRLKLSLGGEALTPDLAAALVPKTGELWNEYGPTETTVLSTSALITDPTRVSIGRPIDNTRIVILDADAAARADRRARRDLHRRPRPGPRLSRPTRADGRAVHPRPVARSPRRTALPQRRPRRDGAPTARWNTSAGWTTRSSCAATGSRPARSRPFWSRTRRSARPRWCCVATAPATASSSATPWPADPERPSSEAELREHLGRQLPDYMVPARLVFLPALPKTPVGKVDRNALPAPVTELPARETVLPQTATETRIATVWAEVLGLDVDATPLGIDDDFFALGGESMKAVRAVRRIDARLPVLDLFAHPTVRSLAAYLDGLDGSAPTERGLLHRLSSIDYTQAELTVVAIPFGGGGAISYRELAAHLPATWAVAGLEPPGHDFARRDEPLVDWDELARRTADAIATEIPGDVVLYGHCVGSALAVAIARRLEDAGRSVLGVAVGANFPAARIPGLLGRLARLWPGSRKSDRALQDALVTLGGLAESLPVEEQRLLARNVRHDAEQAEAFYGAAFAQPERHRLAAPLVCVMGGEDRLSDFAVEQVQDWALFSDRVELDVIAGAEHFFNRQQAPELAATLTEQVARWRAASRSGRAPRTRDRPGVRRGPGAGSPTSPSWCSASWSP